jgi:pyruvate-ferredoxin/flavodoxin oxidoreductase
MQNQKAAVNAGQWLLYRYHPERAAHGANPLQLDSRAPKIPIEQFLYLENRFKMLTKSKPQEARRLLEEAQKDVQTRWRMYEYLGARKPDSNGGAPAGSPVNDK